MVTKVLSILRQNTVIIAYVYPWTNENRAARFSSSPIIVRNNHNQVKTKLKIKVIKGKLS